MRKSWVVLLFVLWTILIIGLTPVLFCFQKETITSHKISSDCKIQTAETRPILDWTGQFTQKRSGFIYGNNYFQISRESNYTTVTIDGRQGLTNVDGVTILFPTQK